MRVILLRWRPLAIGSLLLVFLHLWIKDSFSGPFPLSETSEVNRCNYSYKEEASLQHMLYYCNYREQLSAQDMEGKPTSPGGPQGDLQLVSVHTIIRHGDRIHLNRLPDNTIIPASCRFGSYLKRTVPLVEEYEQKVKNEAGNRGPRRADQSFHGWELYPDRQQCNLGDLTPQGVLQHLLNGLLFRETYINKHGILKTDNPAAEEILVKSSNYSRTYQSAVAFMYGFLPHLDLSTVNIKVADNVTFCSAESGLPCECPAAAKYRDVFPARHRQVSSNLRVQSRRARDVYQHLAEVFDVEHKDLLPPSHLLDMLMVHMCHGQALSSSASGQCVQAWALNDLYDLLADNGQQAVQNPVFQRAVRLGMQPLLHEIAERMVKQGNGQTPLKFVLYSGHDTTVEPLAVTLGFSSGIWARYASRIVFELYRSPSGDLYIRVLYNGRSVTHLMSFCKDLHETDLCPLEHFVAFVRTGNLKDLGETSYSEACEKHIPVDPL